MTLPTLTYYLQFDKKKSIHSEICGEKSQLSNLSLKIVWSIQSNAFLKSTNNTRMVLWQSSATSKITRLILIKANVVDLPAVEPN